MISPGDLAALHTHVQDALAAGDGSGLAVLGYGEISLVVGWPTAQPEVAAKRLPEFPDAGRAARFEEVFERYVRALTERGVDVLDSELHRIDGDDGRVTLYCVQPVLPASSLVPRLLATAGDAEGAAVIAAMVGATAATVDATVGLDAQPSNWAFDGGRLRYLDVTTPLLRDADGTTLLDVDLFVAALPWLIRGAVKRFALDDVVARYHDPRAVLLDLTAQLVKERLESWLPTALAAVNEHVTPPIDDAAVRSYYRGDARLWRFLLAARRVDRSWQRRVRRRTYPFLLPGRVAR